MAAEATQARVDEDDHRRVVVKRKFVDAEDVLITAVSKLEALSALFWDVSGAGGDSIDKLRGLASIVDDLVAELKAAGDRLSSMRDSVDKTKLEQLDTIAKLATKTFSANDQDAQAAKSGLFMALALSGYVKKKENA